ncbi:MAG: orotidine-5'-phosphate decarboxylase [Actinomycetota bacterium]
MTSPLCVALDLPERTTILELAQATEESAGMFKVGLTAFTALGPSIVEELRGVGPVFLDLKLHDIPAQVEGAVRAVAATGASLTTVHASGGGEMIDAAARAARAANGLTIAAVTVLTSLDAGALRNLGIGGSPSEAVVRLAEIALEGGVDALVCSPQEAQALRARFGPSTDGGPLLVVPGIRTLDSDAGDQKRTSTPKSAISAGADIIVVGRPITQADDPSAAARRVLEEIQS